MKRNKTNVTFRIGDLIVAKAPTEDYKECFAIVTDVHEGGEINKRYEAPYIVFRYSDVPEDIKRDFEFMDRVFNLPNKKERWYHYPVKL